ncbi:MAG TPA: hypothetical protein VJ726_08670 [Candidatus Limnocylindria bacterium]|nr:hypothetical protein [Candidatus Limnocylindria bacterium]
MRLLKIVVFALAAVCAFLASTGVAAPPHRVAPGTPLSHTLVLGAYRFAFLIEPLEMPTGMSPEMAALHKAFALAGIPMTNMPGMTHSDAMDLGPIFATSGLHPTQDLAVAFALLVALWPRLPRPTRRLVAELAPARIALAQWRSPLILGPPRI